MKSLKIKLTLNNEQKINQIVSWIQNEFHLPFRTTFHIYGLSTEEKTLVSMKFCPYGYGYRDFEDRIRLSDGKISFEFDHKEEKICNVWVLRRDYNNHQPKKILHYWLIGAELFLTTDAEQVHEKIREEYQLLKLQLLVYGWTDCILPIEIRRIIGEFIH
jgi:hypothetical protein